MNSSWMCFLYLPSVKNINISFFCTSLTSPFNLSTVHDISQHLLPTNHTCETNSMAQDDEFLLWSVFNLMTKPFFLCWIHFLINPFKLINSIKIWSRNVKIIFFDRKSLKPFLMLATWESFVTQLIQFYEL